MPITFNEMQKSERFGELPFTHKGEINVFF